MRTEVLLPTLAVVALALAACGESIAPVLPFDGDPAFGSAASAARFHTSCEDIRDSDAGAADGDYTISPGGQHFSVFCNDMAGIPSEYLTLVNTGGGFNFGQYTAGGASSGSTVRTNYTRVRLDPSTLLVNIGDQTFSSSTGALRHSGTGAPNVFTMPYGTAAACISGGNPAGVANIDLTGTPFAIDDGFAVGGFIAAGSSSLSSADQVANITGGGFCGWNLPAPGAFNPFNAAGGFRLNLKYIDVDDKGECKNGGWAAFGFKNQGQCVRFVETGKDSR